MPDGYRLFVNDERTILVRVWESGGVEVCTREDSDGIWSPPICMEEEK